jgi:hypothetical protein
VDTAPPAGAEATVSLQAGATEVRQVEVMEGRPARRAAVTAVLRAAGELRRPVATGDRQEATGSLRRRAVTVALLAPASAAPGSLEVGPVCIPSRSSR